MHRRELRELADHVFRGMEQNPGMGLGQHGGVVVRVAGGHYAVVEALQGDHRLTLGVFLAQLIADNAIGFIGDQLVAQQGREAQLTHQRLGELVEGVRQNHHLEALTQPVDELNGAVQRLQGGNHFLNICQLQAVLVENAQTLLHQHVVVGNIPSGGFQRFNAGFFREGNPDFRNQHTFQVETGNFHGTLLGGIKIRRHSSGSSGAVQRAAYILNEA